MEELYSNRLVSYAYDRLNRLTEENIKDLANGNETISYAYDNFGNRLEKTDSSKGGMHYGIKRQKDYIVSILSVPCCEDTPGGPVKKVLWKLRWH